MAQLVLFVYHDSLNHEQIAEFLRQQGFDVEKASSGKEAQRKIIDRPPDLLLLSSHLSDTTVSQFCADVRHIHSNHRVMPIVICADKNASVDERLEAFRAGADDVLSSPIQLEELLAHINAVLRRAIPQPKTELLAGIQAVIKKGGAPSPEPDIDDLKSNGLSHTESSSAPETMSAAQVQHTDVSQFIARIGLALHQPATVFADFKTHRDFMLGVVMVLLTPLFGSLAKLIQRPGDFDFWIGGLSLGFVTTGIAWVGIAGLLQMAMPFFGSHVTLREALTVTGLAWAPRFIRSMLTVVYSCIHFLGFSGNSRFTAGIDIIPVMPSNRWIDLLGNIGIFEIWSVWILINAIWKISSAERRWNVLTVVIGLACLALGTLASL